MKVLIMDKPLIKCVLGENKKNFNLIKAGMSMDIVLKSQNEQINTLEICLGTGEVIKAIMFILSDLNNLINVSLKMNNDQLLDLATELVVNDKYTKLSEIVLLCKQIKNGEFGVKFKLDAQVFFDCMRVFEVRKENHLEGIRQTEKALHDMGYERTSGKTGQNRWEPETLTEKEILALGQIKPKTPDTSKKKPSK